LFLADGTWDTTVFKDENASTLTRNYAAAHLQLADHYQRSGQMPLAIAELERVERMFPSMVDVQVPLGKFYLDAGDTVRAAALFERMLRRSPDSPDAHYYMAVARMFQNRLQEALRSFDRAIELDPDYFYAYLGAYTMLWQAGQTDPSLAYLKRWLDRHPDDQQVRGLYEGHLRQLGRAPSAGPPLPRPVMP